MRFMMLMDIEYTLMEVIGHEDQETGYGVNAQRLFAHGIDCDGRLCHEW